VQKNHDKRHETDLYLRAAQLTVDLNRLAFYFLMKTNLMEAF